MPSSKTPGTRHQLRQPRIAEMIAAVLRQRIVNGELADGERLSKQDELLEEFDVSRPSLREALRILETEGLITVRRGNLGGAIVHAPTADSAAYMLGLVMQSGGVPQSDLATALTRLEPLCASLCALRDDRLTAVVPPLQALIDESEREIEDPVKFTLLSRDFHTELVRVTGNATLTLVVGSLTALWSSQEAAWAAAADSRHTYPELPLRRAVIRAHSKLLSAIEKGDAPGAARLAEQHLQATQTHVLGDFGDGSIVVTDGPPGSGLGKSAAGRTHTTVF